MDDYPVILACCGIGLLSAAAVTEAVIGRYAPGAVLNYGCAGAHRVDLLPGDLVIGSCTVAYDSVKMNPDGTEGNVRMWYLRAGVQHKVPYLSAAPHLVAVADHAAREWEGQCDAWPLTAGWLSSVPHRGPRVFVGTVASADRWNHSPERIRALAQQHGSLCEDMEAAAIALTCASHDVPILPIKDISNNELLRVTDERFDAETEGQLGRRAALLTLITMRTLVAQQRLTDRHDGGG
jgi:adenosylhomocysteine nucleosidase